MMIGWFGIVLRNARRSPLRGAMTVSAVAISLLAFLLVRAINTSWTDQVQQTPDNRIVIRNKAGWKGTLPVRYLETVRTYPGIRRATGATWGQLKVPTEKQVPFEPIAVDAEPFIAMHYELQAPDEQKRDFVANRRGALVSAELASELGWTVGDVLGFKHSKVPAGVELTVAGIFQSQRTGFARRSVYFHWDYLNELLPDADRNRVNIIAAEIVDPTAGARMATAIDIEFDRDEGQTLSQEDQAVNAQAVGQFSAILAVLDVVAFLILGVVLLVLSNTLAMVVRERGKEYGALRAIGFVRKHLLFLVLGEAVLLGFIGAALALVLSVPLVEHGASDYLSRVMGLPPLHVSLASAGITTVLGIALGALAGALPGYQLTRVRVVDALKSVG